MKIDIMTSATHPIGQTLRGWANQTTQQGHIVQINHDKNNLQGGDFLFLISCSDMISASTRALYNHTLVVHASDLPKGKGWSPHIWTILNGSNTLTVSLFEAVDKVDAGRIWKKEIINLDGHELYNEINAALFAVTVKLMSFALENGTTIAPQDQNPQDESFFKKRTPDDSRLDPHQSIAAQFNLLRVCDPTRFPAFFDHAGHRYKITIDKLD